jgi:hypothetical protein
VGLASEPQPRWVCCLGEARQRARAAQAVCQEKQIYLKPASELTDGEKAERGGGVRRTAQEANVGSDQRRLSSAYGSKYSHNYKNDP